MLTNYDKALQTIEAWTNHRLCYGACVRISCLSHENLPRWTVLKQFYDELWDLFNLTIPLLTWHHTIRGDFIICGTYEFNIIERFKHSSCFEWVGMTVYRQHGELQQAVLRAVYLFANQGSFSSPISIFMAWLYLPLGAHPYYKYYPQNLYIYLNSWQFSPYC